MNEANSQVDGLRNLLKDRLRYGEWPPQYESHSCCCWSTEQGVPESMIAKLDGDGDGNKGRRFRNRYLLGGVISDNWTKLTILG